MVESKHNLASYHAAIIRSDQKNRSDPPLRRFNIEKRTNIDLRKAAMLIPEDLSEDLVISTIETSITLLRDIIEVDNDLTGQDADIVRFEHKIDVVLHRVGFEGRKLLKELSKIEMLISKDLVDVKVLWTSEICKLSLESLIDANSNLEAQ